VNLDGEPTGSMVQFPTEPMAIHAMCFPYLLAVFAKSVYVYDIRKDLRDAHVQTIPFSNYFLSPSKVESVPVVSWTSVLLMIGHNDMLLFLSQAPLEEQCKEMLRANKFQECLQIAATSQEPGYRDYLTEHSCAEAAFHLLQKRAAWEGGVAEALGFLRKCKAFQPSQLFPLFPEYTRAWRAQVARKRYWSMHPPLTSLDELVKASSEGGGGEAGEAALAAGVLASKRAICDFLLESKTRRLASPSGEGEGLALGDGLDTLVVHLLLDTESVGRLEDLVARPNAVAIAQVEGRLCAVGRVHALALLNESRGEFHAAAELWVSLCEGKRSELPHPDAFLTQACAIAAAGKAQDTPSSSSSSSSSSLMTEVVVPLVARVVKKAHGAAAGGGGGGGGGESGTSTALAFLPWLMEKSVSVSLKLLSDISLTVDDVMRLLKETKDVGSRWKYLDFVVNVQASTDPMHHSEFALAMIDLWKARRQGEGGGAQEEGRKISQEEAGEEEELGGVRSRLQAFLEGSDYYSTQTVLGALRGTRLWLEQVLVNQKIGDHKEALHLLTFTMRDKERAVRYCEQLGTQEGYLTLLDMLLSQDPPLYADAVRLLGSKGAALNPLRVLEALSDEMPMQAAYSPLVRMLRDRMHRKRAGQVVKGLTRSHSLAVAQDRVVSLAEHIEMTGDRACRVCNVRIGTKVFGLYPNGVLVCYRCMMRNGKDAQHICPVTGRDFSKEGDL